MSLAAVDNATRRSDTDDGQPPRRMKINPALLLLPVSFCILMGLWEFSIGYFQVQSFVLPAPSRIAAKVVADAGSGFIFPHFATTLTEVLIGFAAALAAAMVIGTAVALSRIVEMVLYPYILALQTIPKIAVAPLFIIWFGFGLESKIVTAGLIAFFPMLVNVIAGLKSVDPRRLLLMRALRAGPIKSYLKVRLPSMLPFLFAGMETGIIFATLGAIVGEFIGASVGLGAVIIQRQAAMDVAGVFSAILYLSTMGILLNYAVRMLKARLIFW